MYGSGVSPAGVANANASSVGGRLETAMVRSSVQLAVYSRKPIKIAHAVTMSLAFGLFVILGTLASTFAPTSVVRLWFPIHIGLQIIGMALMIAGFGTIVYYIGVVEMESHFVIPGSPTFGAHGVLGLILFLLMFIQALFGVLSDTLWRLKFKKTGVLPSPQVLPEKFHWWLGRFIVLLSVVVMFLGITEFKLPYWVYGIFIAWYGALVLILSIIFAFNYKELRSQLEKEEQQQRAEAIINDDKDVSQDGDVALVPVSASAPDDEHSSKKPQDAAKRKTSIMDGFRKSSVPLSDELSD